MATKEQENKAGNTKAAGVTTATGKDGEQLLCGIIMPISSIDGVPAEHWKEVLSILNDVIRDSGFMPNLVSNANDVGIIQKRIIQNIYNNPIVVCDVSAKNPNVMFELGMRLAFDKPTIIIKDDATDYNFDTSPIEHLTYPRDLRFTTIIEFKELLKSKIKATYKKAKEDPEFSTFLKHFGEYKISKLDKREVSTENFLLQAIQELREDIRYMKNQTINQTSKASPKSVSGFGLINSQTAKEAMKGYIEKKANDYLYAHGFSSYFDASMQDKALEVIDYLWKQPDIKGLFESKEALNLYLADEVYGTPF